MAMRSGWGWLTGIVLLSMAGCTPVTGRQARIWESGRRLETDPSEQAAAEVLEREAEELGSPQREAVEAALALLGTPRSEMDCSAFVGRAWSAAGVQLPRTVREQLDCGSPIVDVPLEPGDLVFFAFESRPADHVGLYVGHGQFLHVSSAAGCVQLASLSDPPFVTSWVAARRPESGSPLDPGA
jgi:cell wall-associated NlpC family hydrolase